MVNVVKAQMVDPAVTSLLASINSIESTSLTLQSAAEAKLAFYQGMEVSAKAVNFIDDLQSLKKITMLLGSIICQTQEMRIYIDLAGSNCLMDIKYNITIVNLQFSTDIIKTVLLAKNLLTMFSSDRLVNLKSVIDALEKTIKEMDFLKSGIKLTLDKMIFDTYLNKNTFQNTKALTYRRY